MCKRPSAPALICVWVAERANWRARLVRTGDITHSLTASGQQSSRMVVNLDCRPKKVHKDLIVLEFGESKAQRSVLYRYRDMLTDTKMGTPRCLQNLRWARTSGNGCSGFADNTWSSYQSNLIPTQRLLETSSSIDPWCWNRNWTVFLRRFSLFSRGSPHGRYE